MLDLAAALARPFHLKRREFHLGASIGVAASPTDGAHAEDLTRHAELALIQAKKRGGNTIEYFSPEMQSRASERLDFENHLRYAIRRGELRLFYQPKVDCRSMQVVGVEALVRWQHPTHGLVPPQRFIPVAEEAGLIDEIGAWALQTACRQGARWLQSALPPIQIAVNLSAAQLLQPGLAAEVAAILADSGLPPPQLTLELTESMLMTAGEQVRGTIDALKALGVALSLDDFGTGYSPLTYLRRLPIDEIKIDRSFVHGLPTQPESAAIAGAIIALADALGLQVVAEGVETAAELDFLRGFAGCRFQGYLFSPPVSADEMTAILQAPGSSETPGGAAQPGALRDA
jgi:EAL domain-containing protein (putative c-di-GMP-specific phosphodiesterase class I)